MKTIDQMHNHVIKKSVEDLQFRDALLADPRGVVSSELGIDFPEDVQFHVHESDMKTIQIALPPRAEMTEEQLEAVAAGLSCGF